MSNNTSAMNMESLKELANTYETVASRWEKAVSLLNDRSIHWSVAHWGSHGLNILEKCDIGLIDIDLLEDRRDIHYMDIHEGLMDNAELLELEESDLDIWREYVLENYFSKGFNSYNKR